MFGLSAFYLIWPLIVALLVFQINSSLINKNFTFLAVSILVNYLVFSAGVVVIIGLPMLMVALKITFEPSVFWQALILIFGLTIYLLLLAVHVLITKILAKKWIQSSLNK